jgi:hypothetical protein
MGSKTTDSSESPFDICMEIADDLKRDDPLKEKYLRKACELMHSKEHWKSLLISIPKGSVLKREFFPKFLEMCETFHDFTNLGGLIADSELAKIAFEKSLKYADNKNQCRSIHYFAEKNGFDDLCDKAICRASEIIKSKEAQKMKDKRVAVS